MRWFVTVTALSTFVACSSSDSVSEVPVYDTCFDLGDCVEVANLCETLAVEFGGFVYENAICTTDCTTEGPLSPDCARAFVGRQGSCYPSSVAGGVDDTLVCLEPCDTSDDCLVGFRCLGAVDLCGSALASCPIPVTDAICVPGPSPQF